MQILACNRICRGDNDNEAAIQHLKFLIQKSDIYPDTLAGFCCKRIHFKQKIGCDPILEAGITYFGRFADSTMGKTIQHENTYRPFGTMRYLNALKNENIVLVAQKRNTCLLSTTLLLCAIAGGFVLYYKTQQCKKAGQLIRRQMHDTLYERFVANKQAILLENYLNESKEGQLLLRVFSNMIPENRQLEWDVLYRSIDELLNGQLGKLRKKYPELDETEFRICCLDYACFDTREIGLTLKLKENSIYRYRTFVRTKIGVPPRSDIIDFLNFTLQEEQDIENENC